MDLVSIETREENEFVKERMINGRIRFFWTSGRKCNFQGCEREDLKPLLVNGGDSDLLRRLTLIIFIRLVLVGI